MEQVKQKNERLNELNQIWREKMLRYYWRLIVLIFFAEVLLGTVLFVAGKVEISIFLYVIMYIVVPTVANCVTLAIVSAQVHSYLPDQQKNFSLCTGLIVICIVISTVHNYFGWSLALFGVPMLISVMLNEKEQALKQTLVACVLGMFVSIFLSRIYDSSINLSRRMFEGTVCIVYLLAIYVVCHALMHFLSDRNAIILEYDQKEEKMAHALTLDAMTSLFNHAEFEKVLEKSRNLCIRENRYMTLIVADIDFFKRVNDTYGHEQGDKVLMSVAGHLQHFCSDKGVAFRYGGEEFAAIFMDKSAHEVREIMEEMRDALSRIQYDFMPEGERVTISVGIYKYGGESNIDVHEIFNRADSAMYEAKKSGRNRCWTYRADRDNRGD